MNFIASLEKASFPSSGQWYSGSNRQVRGLRENDDQNFKQRQNHRSSEETKLGHSYNIICEWEPFKTEILKQWNRLNAKEVDLAGPNRSEIAGLIETRYGIASHLVENYLRNFERTLPLI